MGRLGFISEEMKPDQGNERKCCRNWSKKKICCVSCSGCLSIVAIVVIGLIVVVYLRKTKNMSQVDTRGWEAAANNASLSEEFNIDGVYNLVSFSDNYGDYLTAMGAPWYAVPVVLSSSETLEFMMLENGFNLAVNAGFISKNLTNEWNTWVNTTTMNGVMWSNCNREKFNVIFCRMEQREKNLKLSSKLSFTETGLVNQRVFNSKNITTMKYYEKVTTEE